MVQSSSLEERQRSPAVRRRWLAIAALVAIVAWGPFRFTSSSICSHCGSIRHSVARQLPFIAIPYWTSHTVEPTPLSDSVADLVTTDAHDWLFVHGNGNGVLAIGDGHFLLAGAHSPMLAAFIDAAARHEGEEAASRYLQIALDPEHSENMLAWLAITGFKPSRHAARASYSEWFAEAIPRVSELDGFTLDPPPLSKPAGH